MDIAKNRAGNSFKSYSVVLIKIFVFSGEKSLFYGFRDLVKGDFGTVFFSMKIGRRYSLIIINDGGFCPRQELGVPGRQTAGRIDENTGGQDRTNHNYCQYDVHCDFISASFFGFGCAGAAGFFCSHYKNTNLLKIYYDIYYIRLYWSNYCTFQRRYAIIFYGKEVRQWKTA